MVAEGTWQGRAMKAAHRLCVAVDLAGFAARPPHAQALMQRRLRAILRRVWRRCGVRPRSVWQGDGEVALAPRGADESEIVSAFLREMRVALRRANRDLAGSPYVERMRLRVAMHAGTGATSGAGLVGAGVVRACRLLDASALRSALAADPTTDIAMVVSQSLYEDVICAEMHELTGTDFRPVRIVNEQKAFAADAWLHVADRGVRVGLVPLPGAQFGAPPDRHPRTDDIAGPGSAGADSRVNVASQNHRVGESSESIAPAS